MSEDISSSFFSRSRNSFSAPGRKDMQSPEKEKPAVDQVVLLMEQPNAKPKPSQEKYRDHIDSVALSGEEKTPTIASTMATIRTLRRLQYSKPKARFVEYNYPLPVKPMTISESEDPHPASREKIDSSDDDDDEFEEILKDEENHTEKNRKKKRKIGWRTIVEWVAFIVITACLVMSLTVGPWKEKHLWGLELPLWKWCLMALVVFCGRLVSGWLVGLLAFLIERNYILREKVLYFVYGLRKSVQNCIWLGLVLLSWYIIFNPEVENSTRKKRLLKRVWRALIAFTIAAVIWLVKIILVKMLASSFHMATFFDRMQESVFHYYILEKLSGPPLDELGQEIRPPPSQCKKTTRAKTMPARLSRRMGGTGSRRIDMEKLRRLSRGNSSALTVKRLVSHVMSFGLSSISRTIDEEFREAESGDTSELEAKMSALQIFKHVAKDGEKYIEMDDLLRFLDDEEVQTIFPLFQGAIETGKIKKSAFRNWVVHAYRERKYLAHSLNDTKTAVQQLHKLASAVVIVIIIVMSLVVMGVATTKVIFLITSQLVLVAFMFGNTCKTIFESIVFVFVMHPFDVGDRCVIDGVQMVVEEMNILTTVFLRFDQEKIYYPNSLLLTKAISNFRRSPEMGDNVEFAIDVSISVETFNKMKDDIKRYIESKPKHWQSKHSVVVKEIENVNKMKIVIYLLHTMNHQDYAERNSRRSEFVFELKKILENLDIKYHLLPQQVHVIQV